MRESKVLEHIIRQRAKERQRGGQGGVLLSANLPEAKVDSRDTLANAVGMRARTFIKAREMWDAAETGDTLAADLLQQHANCDLSLSAAYEKFHARRPTVAAEARRPKKLDQNEPIVLTAAPGDWPQITVH
jgi:hypothetical protein